jgi:hypothetical protein
MNPPRQVITNFTALNQTSPTLRVDAGNRLVVGCLSGNATLDLQVLAPDNATWVPVRLPNNVTTVQFTTTNNGAVTLDVAPGQYRLICSAFTSAKTGYMWVGQ